MVQLNQHLDTMTYIAVRQLLPRLHNLCHVDSRVAMLLYSLNMLHFGSNLPCVVCLTVLVPSPYSSIPREKTSELCSLD